ncbi:MAG: oxidoreductase [Candidatus Micrarchaeota archaeon]
MAKKRVAIFSLTCCAGCQLEILDNLELLDMLEHIEIVKFPIAIGRNEPGPYDIAFIEGMVTTPAEIEIVKKVRNSAKCLISIGACACYGGVPTIRNMLPQREAESAVYGNKTEHLLSIKPAGVSEYVKVDYLIHGCPINKEEFSIVVKALLAGKLPRAHTHSVCVECKAKGNRCIFEEQICMGPISLAGCGATCPSNSLACYSCRGPKEDANVDEFITLARKQGYSNIEIRGLLGKFACTARQYKKYIECLDGDNK